MGDRMKLRLAAKLSMQRREATLQNKYATKNTAL